MSNSSDVPVVIRENQNNNNFYLSQSFRDQKQLEAFIKSTKLLKIIEGAADNHVKKFQQNKRPEDSLTAVIVCLPFVYADFLNHIDLLHLLLEEPLLFANAVKYKVYGIVRDFVKKTSTVSGLKSIDIDQVHVQLTIKGLPTQQELIFNPSKNRYIRGLSLVLGILSAFTEPEKDVIQSVWFCSSGCNRNRIKGKCSEAPNCQNCSKQMSEYTKLRVTQDFRLIRLLPVPCVQTPRVINKVFRAITINLKEHTYDSELVLGSRYLVTGYYDYRANAQEFQAWSLTKH